MKTRNLVFSSLVLTGLCFSVLPDVAAAQNNPVVWAVDDQVGIIDDQRLLDHNRLSPVGLTVLAQMLPPEDYGVKDYACNHNVRPPGGNGVREASLSFEDQVKLQERRDKCVEARSSLASHFERALADDKSFNVKLMNMPLSLIDADFVSDFSGKKVNIVACGLPSFFYGAIGDWAVDTYMGVGYPGSQKRLGNITHNAPESAGVRYYSNRSSCNNTNFSGSNWMPQSVMGLAAQVEAIFTFKDTSLGVEAERQIRESGLLADIDCTVVFKEIPGEYPLCLATRIVIKKRDGQIFASTTAEIERRN